MRTVGSICSTPLSPVDGRAGPMRSAALPDLKPLEDPLTRRCADYGKSATELTSSLDTENYLVY